MRHILHIDMNSFFASCEQAANPDLKKQPLIVGGDPQKRHGIVLAASYDAKKRGVKTTMPIWKAAELCPEAKIVQPNHFLYSKMSKQVMRIFDQYTPVKEQLSIDEAFLDMTGTEKIFGSIVDVAKRIQSHIQCDLDLPCSVGISSNKFLAKMASDMKKPKGITILYLSDIEEKLWPLPVGQLYGVGKKTAEKLGKMGIKTVKDLALLGVERLRKEFGDKTALMLHQAANGMDDAPVVPNEEQETKSVSNEITFGSDMGDMDSIRKEILTLADSVAWRLRKLHTKGKTISIKIKYQDFSVITRNRTLKKSTDITDTIYKEALELFAGNWNRKKPIRLIGVGISNLGADQYEQISLLELDNEVENEKKEKLDKTLDQLRDRYGYDVFQRAALLEVPYGLKKK